MLKGFDSSWQSIRQMHQSHLFCPATEIGQKLSRLLLCNILLSSEVLSTQSQIKAFRNREEMQPKHILFQQLHGEFYAAQRMLLAGLFCVKPENQHQ